MLWSPLCPGRWHPFIANGRGIEEISSRIDLARFAFCRGMKYQCVKRAGSTRQWCVRLCSTVTKRGQCESQTKGCWCSLTMTGSATSAYQRQNCHTASASLVCLLSSSKEGFVGSAILHDVPMMDLLLPTQPRMWLRWNRDQLKMWVTTTKVHLESLSGPRIPT